MNIKHWKNMKVKKIMNEVANPDFRTNPTSNKAKSFQLEIETEEFRREPDFRWIRVAKETVSFSGDYYFLCS